MEGQEKKNNGVIIGAVSVLVLLVAVYGYYSYSNRASTSPVTQVTPTPTTEAVPTEVVKVNTNTFNDGSYSAVGDYNSPGGAEQIGVTVTLKDDVITDAAVKVMATRPISKNMQTMVSNNIKSFVVGKKLNDVVLDKVSGSSLTPKGWNDAISKISSQAHV